MILGDRERASGDAVAQREKRAFGARHPFLEHEWAESSGSGNGGDGGVIGVGDVHALSRGEAVLFDHHRSPELAPPVKGLVGQPLIEPCPLGARNPELRGELSGEGLGRLEPGVRGCRSEARHAQFRAPVGDSGDERSFRAGHDEVVCADERVVRVGVDLDGVPVLSAHPCDRLFAPTRSDDEDPHQASTPSKESLACPIDTGTG